MPPRGSSKKIAKDEDEDCAPDKSIRYTNQQLVDLSLSNNDGKKRRKDQDEGNNGYQNARQAKITNVTNKQPEHSLSTASKKRSSAAETNEPSNEKTTSMDQNPRLAKKQKASPPVKKNTLATRPRATKDGDSKTRVQDTRSLEQDFVDPKVKKDIAATRPKANNASNAAKEPEVIDLSNEEPTIIDEKPRIICKKFIRPTQGFPRFDDGDVYIELKFMNHQYTYLLHSRILSSNSPWFKEALSEPWDDLDTERTLIFTERMGIVARFELFRHPESDVEVVQRTFIDKFSNLKNVCDIFPKTEKAKIGTIVQAVIPAKPLRVSELLIQNSSKRATNRKSMPTYSGLNIDGASDAPSSQSEIAKNETDDSTTALQQQLTSSDLNQDSYPNKAVSFLTYIRTEPHENTTCIDSPEKPTASGVNQDIDLATAVSGSAHVETKPCDTQNGANARDESIYPDTKQTKCGEIYVEAEIKKEDEYVSLHTSTCESTYTLSRTSNYQINSQTIPQAVVNAQNQDVGPDALHFSATPKSNLAQIKSKYNDLKAGAQASIKTESMEVVPYMPMLKLEQLVAGAASAPSAPQARIKVEDSKPEGTKSEDIFVDIEIESKDNKNMAHSMDAQLSVELQAGNNEQIMQNTEHMRTNVKVEHRDREPELLSTEGFPSGINFEMVNCEGSFQKTDDALMDFDVKAEKGTVYMLKTEVDVSMCTSESRQATKGDLQADTKVQVKVLDLGLQKPEDTLMTDAVEIEKKESIELKVESAIGDGIPGVENHEAIAEAIEDTPMTGVAEIDEGEVALTEVNFKADPGLGAVDSKAMVLVAETTSVNINIDTEQCEANAPKVEIATAVSRIRHKKSEGMVLKERTLEGFNTEAIESGKIMMKKEDPYSDKAHNTKTDTDALTGIKYDIINSKTDLLGEKNVNIKNNKATPQVWINVEMKNNESAAQQHVDLREENVRNGVPKVEYTPRQKEYLALEKEGRVQIANPRPEILDAYNNLFLIYYGQVPVLNYAKFGLALEQIELLVKIAGVCGSIAVVKPYLESALFRFQREVHNAIQEDPPRWLMLSLKLKSEVIYREAVIHLVARYPFWPSSSKVTFNDIPERVRALMEICWNETALMKAEIDSKLLCNSVAAVGEGDFVVKDKAQIHTWFVVQFWRNWLTEALKYASAIEEDRKENEYGALYRLIAQGGEAYLPFEKVIARLSTFLGKEKFREVDVKQVGKALTSLKKQAQEIVAPLCINNSMLSVGDGGIKYLTCYQIENENIPWIAMPDEFEL